jgi:hypothetical protein
MRCIAAACLATLFLLSGARADELNMPEFVGPEPTCGPLRGIVGTLATSGTKESAILTGTILGNKPAGVIITVNPTTGAWTLLVSPDGKTACFVMMGTGLQPVPLSKILGPPL